MTKLKTPGLVVLSGGQDSVTCLGIAMLQHFKVYAVGFNYGQKHSVELGQAAKICKEYDIEFEIINLGFLGDHVTSALTSDGDVNAPHPYKKNLPASFVPARNALFLTMAHGVAQELRCEDIYTGVCQTDYSGYPDCRETFVTAMEQALNIGYETQISIRTPLMHLTKAETFKLADDVGILETVIEDSHTCYNGNRSDKHDWGRGCGACPACELREKGYTEFLNNKNIEK